MLTPLSLTGLSLRELPYGSRLLVGQAHGVPCRHTQPRLMFSGIPQQVCMYVSLVRLSIPWRKHLRTCLLLYLYSLQYRCCWMNKSQNKCEKWKNSWVLQLLNYFRGKNLNKNARAWACIIMVCLRISFQIFGILRCFK